MMFDSSDFPKALEESTFESWLEAGRNSKISFAYLLIIWDDMEGSYSPVYVENRSDMAAYSKYGDSPEPRALVAAYDLYSESRVA